jgi:hypothetical protein
MPCRHPLMPLSGGEAEPVRRVASLDVARLGVRIPRIQLQPAALGASEQHTLALARDDLLDMAELHVPVVAAISRNLGLTSSERSRFNIRTCRLACSRRFTDLPMYALAPQKRRLGSTLGQWSGPRLLSRAACFCLSRASAWARSRGPHRSVTRPTVAAQRSRRRGLSRRTRPDAEPRIGSHCRRETRGGSMQSPHSANLGWGSSLGWDWVDFL